MPGSGDFNIYGFYAGEEPAKILQPKDVYRIKYLQDQPDFPLEDLTEDNADFLADTLPFNPGVDQYAGEITASQRSLHDLAVKALAASGARTQPGLSSLYAFSHGFASFETMYDLIHGEPTDGQIKIYGKRRLDEGVGSIGQYFINLKASDEPEAEPEDDFELSLLEAFPELNDTPPSDDDWQDPVAAREERQQADLDLIKREHPGVAVSPAIAQHWADLIRREKAHFEHHLPHAEKIFIEHQERLADSLPNTFDTLVAIGQAKKETAPQVAIRLAGAALAHALKSVG